MAEDEAPDSDILSQEAHAEGGFDKSLIRLFYNLGGFDLLLTQKVKDSQPKWATEPFKIYNILLTHLNP